MKNVHYHPFFPNFRTTISTAYNLALFRKDKKIHSFRDAPLTAPNVFLLELPLLRS